MHDIIIIGGGPAGLTAGLYTARARLNVVLKHGGSIAQAEGVEAYLADAAVFLEFFGTITIAWQWLLQAVHSESLDATARKKANRRFYSGKRHTCDYFFKYELPKTVALARTLMGRRRPTLEIAVGQF